MTTKTLSEIRKGDRLKLPSGHVVTAAADAEMMSIETVWRFPVVQPAHCDYARGAAYDELQLADDANEWPKELEAL